MDRETLKTTAAVALGAGLYWLSASFSLPYAGIFLPNVSGLAPAGVYLVMHLTNAAVLIAFSVPFALVLASNRLSLHRPVLAGLAIASLGLVAPVALQTSIPHWAGAGVRWSHAVDLAKFALMLPALTWLAITWLPSNNSSKPTPLRGAA
jgi:hypothetical protein